MVDPCYPVERDRQDERREGDDFPAPELARAAEQIARAKPRTLSAVVRDALRDAQAVLLRKELEALQGDWSRWAKERLLGIRDLELAVLPRDKA